MLNVKGEDLCAASSRKLGEILDAHATPIPASSKTQHGLSCPLCWGVFSRLGRWGGERVGEETGQKVDAVGEEKRESEASLLEQVRRSVVASRYQAVSFASSITVPPSLDLRERGTYHHLSDKVKPKKEKP
jgi:hypothetical protein